MGFMDNIKKAQDMAQQAAQGMGDGGMSSGAPSAEDVAYSQLAQKVWNQGLPGVATIKAISETGRVDGPSKQFEIQVDVELEAAERYSTTIHQFLPEATSASYQPGSRFEIKVDPDDKTKGLLYGAA